MKRIRTWAQVFEYAKTQNVRIQEYGNGHKYELWHANDHSVAGYVNTIEEALQEIEQLVYSNK